MSSRRRPALSPSPVQPYRLWRWTLLVSVISGILGMHVLTGGDMSAGHGPLPTPTHGVHAVELPSVGTGHPHAVQDAADSTPADAVVTLVRAEGSDPAGGMDHGGMAACILFLVVGGAALLSALSAVRRRRRGDRLPGSVGAGAAGVMRRGPPGWGLPRLALCVYRI